jgi:hypothetical protein
MPTHKKRAYNATCTQYDGWNDKEVLDLLNDANTYAVKYGADSIIVRFSKASMPGRAIETITPGWWVVAGENGVKKCYDDATFRVKYEAL